MDMDGVLVHEEQAIPGADRFLANLRKRDAPFLVLTNNSIYTRRDLAARLRASGLEVPEESIWSESAERYPYRPARIVDSVADLAEELE